MSGKRRKHSSEFKARLAMEALKEDRSLSEIGAEYGIHPQLVGQWKQEFIENSGLIFNRKNKEKQMQEQLKEKDQRIEELYKEVGQLTLETNWLKKKARQVGAM